MPRRARFVAKCDACDDVVTTTYTSRSQARINAQRHASVKHPDEDPGVFVVEESQDDPEEETEQEVAGGA